MARPICASPSQLPACQRSSGGPADKPDRAFKDYGQSPALANLQIEWQDAWVVGALIGLEAKYTFCEGEARRKRWARLLYEGTRQFHAVAQGASPEDYDYWLPMLNEMMMTLKID